MKLRDAAGRGMPQRRAQNPCSPKRIKEPGGCCQFSNRNEIVLTGLGEERQAELQTEGEEGPLARCLG